MTEKTCQRCFGDGYIEYGFYRCPDCHGLGEMPSRFDYREESDYDDEDESCTDLEERLDRAFNRAEHLKDCEDGK